MENPDFLKQKYSDLPLSDEVESAAERTQKRTGEKVSHKPAERIQNYLNRFNEILARKDADKRERGIEALREILHETFVIAPEAIPESSFLLEQRIARELGHGDVEITDEFREQKTEQIIHDQTQSLDKWVDYLSSQDATYPDWAKYWAFRSMLEMGKLQKEESEDGKESARFQKRTKDSVASFPPLNPRALAVTIGVIQSKLREKEKAQEERKPVANASIKLNNADFQTLLSTENFSKLYAQFLIEMPEYSIEGLQETRGKWVQYSQGSDPTRLVESLDGYPLEWCTANTDTARTQLEGGDFYVYYSLNQNGEAIIPRVAIRMQEDSIAEVRGIAPNQNIDPYIAPVVQDKMKEFPDGEKYKKKSHDMKFLTEIEKKQNANKPLSKDELIFLYEINSPIEGFGYDTDPRIEEIRSQRNQKEDLPILFDCTQEQIAFEEKEIHEDTKAYIGEWNPEVFHRLPKNIAHVYESFPDKKVFIRSLATDPSMTDAKKANQILSDKGFEVNGYAKEILQKISFSKERKEYHLVSFSVGQLGFPEGAILKNLYQKAQELGLEICPAEIGPQLRLQYSDQPKDEYLRIAMEPMNVSAGFAHVFIVEHDGYDRWLGTYWGGPDDVWGPDGRFVFVSRK